MAERDPAVLTALGLSEIEARVYLAVVDYPASTATDLVHRTGMSQRAVRRSLVGLVSKRLVLRMRYGYHRYRITPPEMALTELVATRVELLERARALVEELIRCSSG